MGEAFNPNNATETHSIFVNTFLVLPGKGNRMVNFYIANALGQNLANSESCPILRLF